MKKNCCCHSLNTFQPMPVNNEIARNVNLSLSEIKEKIQNEKGIVYIYKLSTIRFENNQMQQKGSAPNFQGGLITLCTCKKYLRTYSEIKTTPRVWIAGLTSSTKNIKNPFGSLFYLMKIGERYESFYDIWLANNKTVQSAKSACNNELGDFYEPKIKKIKEHSEDRFNSINYEFPNENHSHIINDEDEWRTDIECVYNNKRRPVLLSGNINFSFLWSAPKIKFNEDISRGGLKCSSINNFFKKLEEN
ncbi:hypothetical protein KA977_08680 [Candidatus Dependentiae bacterium]|nr:hypothetical protein [Candidatus Dependentiae bacterium]